ncbi:xanthine dehydrogenase family protein molybdopterin-binding subunit [Sediminibacterium ginsengisoli]|uniref:Xanthine dehydrogenase YagR molybdenum-binding subunit n=1 Tax=Sediminibacterium ginsengisoli TaxID=413434 RepID=A0A1T4JYX5_9BACT|nr:xanthine dehydrogenase family protein molybdopterin-binding subunit [Sediminibacterium ginsengisoli]SJZ35390.1 xanthine dehydrogenase YagR molybdenum-binding subunit [Sediminibacterium ginsengisoli]
MEKQFFFDADTPDPDRVDGRAKVTGSARYFAEYTLPDMTYGVLVTSPVTKGRIKALDTKAAEKAPGVIAVLSHLNKPSVPGYEAPPAEGRGPGMRIFYTDKIYFNGQPVALVVADSFERATYAATLVRAQYEKEEFRTDFDANLDKAVAPRAPGAAEYKRGNIDAYKNAEVQLESEYFIPTEMHNPMELHGILAHWESPEKVIMYAKTQGVKATQQTVTNLFKLQAQNVQVFSEFVGGAFGIALRTWPHEVATVMAAKMVGKPVKLVLTREQMFTMVGYRPQAKQKLGMGATKAGILTGITHEAIGQTATYDEFTEGIVNMTKFMYACPNVNTRYKVLPLDVCVPIWMRGPGEATGAFALESAMDEMAYRLGIDPVEFRIRNYAETDPQRNQPFSSKYVKEAYQMGADKIGWSKRNPVPGSMKNGDWQVGYGMSTGVFTAGRGGATVRAVISDDGMLLLQSAVSDIGPGTGTAMVKIASDLMGMPFEKIRFELGNSSLPPAPSQGGSSTLSTVGSAVNDACLALQEQLAILAGQKTFAGKTKQDIVFSNGRIGLKNEPASAIGYAELLRQNNTPAVEVTKDSRQGEAARKYSIYSFSIHFVEVNVHPATGVVKVTKIVSVGDAGTIVSAKTAASQMIGGAVGGIGMALTEEAIMDHRFGRYVNHNFADYHVPVHADVPHVESLFINKPDPIINPMGAKGMGEIALIGFSAAVANAVFHATGKRIRSLPITPDKILQTKAV